MLFKLYDTVITQRSALSAMILSAESIGTHGAAMVDRVQTASDIMRDTRTLTKDHKSRIEQVSPMHNPELWFETLLARQKEALKNAK